MTDFEFKGRNRRGIVIFRSVSAYKSGTTASDLRFVPATSGPFDAVYPTRPEWDFIHKWEL